MGPRDGHCFLAADRSFSKENLEIRRAQYPATIFAVTENFLPREVPTEQKSRDLRASIPDQSYVVSEALVIQWFFLAP